MAHRTGPDGACLTVYVRRRHRRLAALAVVVPALLVACGSDDDSTTDETATDETAGTAGATEPTEATGTSGATEPSGEAPAADELVMFTPSGAAVNFDPANGSMNVFNFLAPVYDTLIMRTSDGGFQPNLATEWGYTDPTTFTLTLRTDVTFEDGTPLDAQAVVANIENVKAGAGAYAGQFGNFDMVTAVDESTVEISLATPDPTLPVLLSTVAGMIANPAALGTDGLATTPAGTGAYTYNASESVADDTLVYDLRDDYWNPGHHHFSRVTLRIFSDEMAAANAVLAGEVDISEFGTPGPVSRILDSDMEFTGAPFNVWGVHILDRDGTLVEALGNTQVRQALSYAVDRQTIVDTVQNGVGEPTTQILKDWMEGYDPALQDAYPYDPDRAVELLEEAGYPDGFSFQVVSISLMDQYAQAVQAYLADIGVDLQIETVPLDQYISSIFSGEYPATFLPWGAVDSFFDFGQLYTPDAAFNPFGVSNDEFNALYEQAASAGDDERDELLRQINTLMVEEGWALITNGDAFGLGYDPDAVQPAAWTGLRPYLLYDWLPGGQS